MNLLSCKNSKLRKSGILSFGIPAGFTCPAAKACAAGCYAKAGFFVIPVVKEAQERRLAFTKTPDFAPAMVSEIKRRKVQVLRIHDSGDFYSVAYLNKWMEIIRACPDTKFYAYTKMIPLFVGKPMPKNFRVIFSFGGKYDNWIVPELYPHSRVFTTKQELDRAGYSDASHDDTVALRARKIGLVYHGPKSRVWATT